jgi:ActR/RegA family two-component response regulator
MLTLLYVDDDIRHRDSLVKDLPKGYTVHTAATYSEALALAKRCSPDVAILDIQIPDDDPKEPNVNIDQRQRGIALAKTLCESYRNIGILFYSGFSNCATQVEQLYRERASRHRTRKNGTGYILKGSDVHDIHIAIQNVALGFCHIAPNIPVYQFRTASRQFLATLEPRIAQLVKDAYRRSKELSGSEYRTWEALANTNSSEEAARMLGEEKPTAVDNTAQRIYGKLFVDHRLPQKTRKAKLAGYAWTLYALEEGIMKSAPDAPD